jgi:hypothetical protein
MSGSSYVGGAAGAMLLYSLLAALGIVGLWIASYSAHIFLAALEQTAAGSDDVTWPDEPYTDWLWKGAYFWGLAALWPLVLWVAVRKLPTPPSPTARLIVSALIVWLLFPISLLSSLSSTSILVVFRLQVVRRLAQRWDATLAFLLVSAVVPLAVMFANYQLMFGRDSSAAEQSTSVRFVAVPVVAFLSVVLLLTYARMVGRLGWILRPHRVRKVRKKLKGLPLPAPDAPTPTDESPPVYEVEPEPEEGTYGLRDDETPARTPIPRQTPEESEDDDADEPEVSPLPDKSWNELVRPSVFLFPLYEKSLPALSYLTLGWTLLLAITLGVTTLYENRFSPPRQAPTEAETTASVRE